jgi:uncharacterized protein
MVTAHALAVGVLIVNPVSQHFTMRKLKQKCTSRERIKFYRIGLADYWISALVIFGLLGLQGVLTAGGFLPEATQALSNPILRYSLLAVAIAVCVVALLPLLSMRFKPSMKREYSDAVAKSEFAFLMPETDIERRYFTAISFSAGVCEEIIFRSFMVWYFASFFGFSAIVAFLLASVLFGIGHKYQGLAGVIKTGVIGMVMGLLYFTTGSLFVPMILHALIDLAVVFLYRPELVANGPSPEAERSVPRNCMMIFD